MNSNPFSTKKPRWQRGPGSGPGGISAARPGGNLALSVDKAMLSVVLGLTLFGPVMVYSASAMLAEKYYGNQFHFLARQGIWAVLGLVAMGIAIRVDYRHYRQRLVVFSLLGATLVLLTAVFFFPTVNGTHRWIRYGGFLSVQPSEVAKLAIVIFLAYWLEKNRDSAEDSRRTFWTAALVGGTIVALVASEPDLGSALAVGAVFAVVMFQGGVPLRRLAILAIPVVPALAYMLLFVPWRLQRLLDFLDPWKNQKTSGFQVVQSLIAIGSGGTSGVGFSQGKQKLFYLPAPHTDFIFAVIGEELGLIGASTVVLLFALLAWRGLRAARFAPDVFGQLIAVGLTVMIAAQALFNMSVTLSLVPTKGIPLPFISAGGSSLAISLFAAGVLLNVSKHTRAGGQLHDRYGGRWMAQNRTGPRERHPGLA